MVPVNYSKYSSYFKEALSYLSDYRWLYNFAVTDVLVDDVLLRIPNDWISALMQITNDELNEIPNGFVKSRQAMLTHGVRREGRFLFGYESTVNDSFKKMLSSAVLLPCAKFMTASPSTIGKGTGIQDASVRSLDDWPESLVVFCSRSQALRLVLEDGPDSVDPSRLPHKLQLNLSHKKRHEVCRLASLVHQECQTLSITRVLDVGAGLGYLGRLLHHQYGYQVLGVDVDGQKVDTAGRRQLSCCPSSVSYISSELTAGSEEFVGESVRAMLSRPAPDCSCGGPRSEENGSDAGGVCVVGLHACGDLAPTTLDLFVRVPELRSLVLVPCCHHKMSPDGTGGRRLFPLSTCLRDMVEEIGLADVLLLLRLASQETAARWRRLSEADHQEHSFNVLSRAVLQLHAHKENLKLVKKRRRGVRRTKLKTASFSDFLDDALERYDHVGEGVVDAAEMRAQLERLWLVHGEQRRAVELLTALQVVMQAPAEHLVTLDRLAYLREATHGAEALVVRAMDDFVSPRCLALVTRKPWGS